MNGNLLMGGGAGYDKEAKEAGSNLLTNVVRSFKAAAGDDESQHVLNLAKAAAKKKLAKSAPGGGSEGVGEGVAKVASQLLSSSGGAGGGSGVDPAGGSDPTGDAMQGAIQGFASSGGNPYAAIAGAAMGLIGSSQKRKAAKAQARAKGIQAQVEAEGAKMQAKQNMASAISRTLLSGPLVSL